MDLKQPFKSILKVCNFYALWGENSQQYKKCAFIAHILIFIVPGTLNILSVNQIKDGNDAVMLLIYFPAYVLCYSFIVFLILKKSQIKEFCNHLNKVFNEDPESKVFIENSYMICKIFYVISSITVVLIISGTFFTSLYMKKLPISMLFPESLNQIPGSFYILWFYQFVSFSNVASVVMNLGELNFYPLVMIYGYFKYCENRFHLLDIKLCTRIHITLKE